MLKTFAQATDGRSRRDWQRIGSGRASAGSDAAAEAIEATKGYEAQGPARAGECMIATRSLRGILEPRGQPP